MMINIELTLPVRGIDDKFWHKQVILPPIVRHTLLIGPLLMDLCQKMHRHRVHPNRHMYRQLFCVQ
jgi:hypothetical protein